MMPFSLIEAASSSRDSSPKFRRGLRGLGRRNSIGIFWWPRTRVAAASVSWPLSKAASPRRRCFGGFSWLHAEIPRLRIILLVPALELGLFQRPAYDNLRLRPEKARRAVSPILSTPP